MLLAHILHWRKQQEIRWLKIRLSMNDVFKWWGSHPMQYGLPFSPWSSGREMQVSGWINTQLCSPRMPESPLRTEDRWISMLGFSNFTKGCQRIPWLSCKLKHTVSNLSSKRKVPPSQVIVKDYKSEFSCALFKLLVERKYLQRGPRRTDNLLSPPNKFFPISLNEGNNNINIY